MNLIEPAGDSVMRCPIERVVDHRARDSDQDCPDDEPDGHDGGEDP